MNNQAFKASLMALFKNRKLSYIDNELISDLKIVFPPENMNPFTFNESQKTALEEIFLQRYHALKNTDYQYTSIDLKVKKCNEPWINLAKIVCDEGGFYSFHYYKLLMPFVENLYEFEHVQYQTIHELPLDELLLTYNGKYLVSLITAIASAKANLGRLAVPQADNSRPNKMGAYVFTISDEMMFKSMNPKLWAQYNEFELARRDDLQKRKEKLCITKATVYELILAVESATFRRGGGSSYNKQELDFAHKSYTSFIEYLYLVSKTERTNLMEQTHINGYKKYRFSDIWNSIVKKGEASACTALSAKEFCRLILQYEPEYQFNSFFISSSIEQEGIREGITPKKYDARNPFSDQKSSASYYHYRLIQLVHNFLTNLDHSGENTVCFYGEEANVSLHIKQMFDLIVKGLNNNTYLETYFKLQLELVLSHLTIYQKEAKKDTYSFFPAKNAYGLSALQENFLINILHGNFFKPTPLDIEELCLEKLLLMQLLILEGITEPSERSVPALNHEYTTVLTISKATEDSNEIRYSRAYLSYLKIQLLVQRQDQIHLAQQSLELMSKSDAIYELKQRESRKNYFQAFEPQKESGGCQIS